MKPFSSAAENYEATNGKFPAVFNNLPQLYYGAVESGITGF